MDTKIKQENERKKEYLNRYQEALRDEKRAEEEIETYRIKAMFPQSQQISDMPKGSGGQQDLSAYAADVDEMLHELRLCMDECQKLRKEIFEVINAVPDATERLVLKYRYIDGLKWEDVAVHMDYCWQHIHKLHSKALRDIRL